MKKVFISILISSLLLLTGFVYALTSEFSIDCSNLSFVENSNKQLILNSFNEKYALSHSITVQDASLEEEITKLTKKTTYLLLGDFNNTNESSKDYYKRHQEYLDMGAYKTFPRDENTSSGYDETISNYSYATISEFAVPSMFLEFNELGIIYSYYGDIRITKNEDLIISSIVLPNVKIKEENTSNPMEYDIVETNLTITYYFIKIEDEYKLAYLFGETDDKLDNYFTEIENTEEKSTMKIASSYDSNLKEIYDYSKLEAVSEEKINDIYNQNKNSIVVLNSYYNNYLVATANGFFINEGIVITTWDFLEKSLTDAQYITLKDSDGNSYEIEGIITVNLDTDIAVIKLKDRVERKVNLANVEDISIEDAALAISSKTGVGLTLQKGIVVSNEGYIQSTIPLSTSDQGSPLFDKNGNVIGINTAKQVNASISLAVNSNVLKEVQDKFNNIEFNLIETITFDSMKEEYYYVKYNDEIVQNSIPAKKWEKYSKIGNVEENIKLELLKASYEDGVISLRYQNKISNYISSMQFASAFKEQLIEEGYIEVLDSSNKCIYENDEYKVIITDEFNYLIVVMVKL